jgi:glyoxylase-like metal-dependent hydrolase (beta-lactamase superfamily II)
LKGQVSPGAVKLNTNFSFFRGFSEHRHGAPAVAGITQTLCGEGFFYHVKGDHMKKVCSGIAVVLLLLAVGTGLIFSKMPKKGPPLVDLPGGVQGVLCRFSYSWIIPSRGGVVLIDAGLDEKAPDIMAELKRKGLGPESVQAVLITHGHGDHFGGAGAFSNARVFADKNDIPFIRGEKKRAGLVGSIFGKISSGRKPPKNLDALPETDSILIDGLTIGIIRLPGHSPGSVAYLLGDILFTGDALMGGQDGVMPPPFFSSDNPEQSKKTLAALLKLPFSTIADGHTGAVFDGHKKLEAYLKKQ